MDLRRYFFQQRTLIQTLKNEMKKRGILLDIVFRNNLEDGNEMRRENGSQTLLFSTK